MALAPTAAKAKAGRPALTVLVLHLSTACSPAVVRALCSLADASANANDDRNDNGGKGEGEGEGERARAPPRWLGSLASLAIESRFMRAGLGADVLLLPESTIVRPPFPLPSFLRLALRTRG